MESSWRRHGDTGTRRRGDAETRGGGDGEDEENGENGKNSIPIIVHQVELKQLVA